MTVIVVIIRGGDLGGSRVSGMVTSTEAATGMTVRAPTPSRNRAPRLAALVVPC
jgi:3-methyladenine DNA glycosylase Mpg